MMPAQNFFHFVLPDMAWRSPMGTSALLVTGEFSLFIAQLTFSFWMQQILQNLIHLFSGEGTPFAQEIVPMGAAKFPL